MTYYYIINYLYYIKYNKVKYEVMRVDALFLSAAITAR